MEIIPLRRLIWSDAKGEYVEMDSYGYQVVARDGKVLATSDTREGALRAACEQILLPKHKYV